MTESYPGSHQVIPLFHWFSKVGRRGVISGEQLERITRITILGKQELSFLDHNNYHLLRAYVSGTGFYEV